MTSVPSAGGSATKDSLESELRLSLVSGIGPLLRKALIEHFGSPARVLASGSRQLREVPGVGPKLAEAIASADRVDVRAELELCERHQIDVVTQDDARYPRLLREIPDPPGLLFCQGQLLPRDAVAIAIVGTRHATSYGRKQAEQLSMSLARAGMTIVSGLARGIDGVAHEAALAAGGRTIGVLASGLLEVFPPEHKNLVVRMIESGAVLSENPPRYKPFSGAFPRRNRLITGMCLGVIIVEASQRSGALISARHAMEQGREVFAVPGRVDSRMSRGCHELLRDGARLVQTADDVLEELGPLVEATPSQDGRMMHHPAELQLTEQERSVLDCVGIDPTSIDQIAHDSRLPIHRVLSTVSVLEVRRLVRRVSGNTVVRP